MVDYIELMGGWIRFNVGEKYLCFGGIVLGLLMFVFVDVVVYLCIFVMIGFKVLLVMISCSMDFMCKFEVVIDLIGEVWLLKLGK